MTIVTAIVALCVVIILHELGHYLAAVWTGMKVDRFSVFGIGPTVVKLGTWRGTEFVISAIPFGAFVLVRGMEPDPDYDEPDAVDMDAIDDDAYAKASAAARADSDNYRDKPVWARMFMVVGGPAANYLTAMVLFFICYMAAGVPGPANRIEISSLKGGARAEAAELLVGDRVTVVDGAEVDPLAGPQPIIDILVEHPEQPVELTIVREGETLSKTVVPNEDGKIGAVLGPKADRQPIGAADAIPLALVKPFTFSKRQLEGLWKLITFQQPGRVGGPVQIVAVIVGAIEGGLIPFIWTVAIISTLLGLFNLIPLPALDGGRLTFLVYEAVARRKSNPRIEEMVHGYGILVLLSLMAVVTVMDILELA